MGTSVDVVLCYCSKVWGKGYNPLGAFDDEDVLSRLEQAGLCWALSGNRYHKEVWVTNNDRMSCSECSPLEIGKNKVLTEETDAKELSMFSEKHNLEPPQWRVLVFTQLLTFSDRNRYRCHSFGQPCRGQPCRGQPDFGVSWTKPTVQQTQYSLFSNGEEES